MAAALTAETDKKHYHGNLYGECWARVGMTMTPAEEVGLGSE